MRYKVGDIVRTIDWIGLNPKKFIGQRFRIIAIEDRVSGYPYRIEYQDGREFEDYEISLVKDSEIVLDKEYTVKELLKQVDSLESPKRLLDEIDAL